MDRILAGLRNFQQKVFPTHRALFKRLASSQSPETLFLTCADSRVVPDLITQTRPGELFVCRNAGNIAPPYSDVNGGVSATIEYAVMVLNVKDIIVCGHSDCGAMTGVLHPQKLAGMPNVAAWLRHADRARLVVEENYPGLQGEELLNVLIEQNVLAQLENLRTHPSVASRMMKGQLRLHGWVYEIGSGIVRAWNPAEQRFTSPQQVRTNRQRLRPAVSV